MKVFYIKALIDLMLEYKKRKTSHCEVFLFLVYSFIELNFSYFCRGRVKYKILRKIRKIIK